MMDGWMSKEEWMGEDRRREFTTSGSKRRMIEVIDGGNK